MSYRYRPCTSQVGRSVSTITVPLGRPLNGETFGGLNRSETAAPLDEIAEPVRYPRLVGLNVASAIEILTANGLTVGQLIGPEGEAINGPDAADAIDEFGIFNVARQSPPPGSARSPRPTAVTLTSAYNRR